VGHTEYEAECKALHDDATLYPHTSDASCKIDDIAGLLFLSAFVFFALKVFDTK